MVEKKQYSEEFKREAIRLQETSGKRVAAVESTVSDQWRNGQFGIERS